MDLIKYTIKYTLFLVLLSSLLNCGDQKEKEVDVSQIDAQTTVIRFDQLFYTAAPEDLDSLKAAFPYLFPEPTPDSVWTAKMQDEDELFLYHAAEQQYDDFEAQKEGLLSLFKHVKYYYPRFREPKVFTILSNVDYNNKVIYADSLLFISIDTYLGKDHKVYKGYPAYIRQNFTKEQLLVDVAEQLSMPVLKRPETNSFVSRMIQEGKKLYVMHAFLPEVKRSDIVGYDATQYLWAEANESDMWKYFINKEMLYSNDQNLSERFLADAPFSKFYLEVDQDSPGRIGAYFGWQIVDSFMKNNELSLQEMILMDNEELFKKSKYKPKKL